MHKYFIETHEVLKRIFALLYTVYCTVYISNNIVNLFFNDNFHRCLLLFCTKRFVLHTVSFAVLPLKVIYGPQISTELYNKLKILFIFNIYTLIIRVLIYIILYYPLPVHICLSQYTLTATTPGETVPYQQQWDSTRIVTTLGEASPSASPSPTSLYLDSTCTVTTLGGPLLSSPVPYQPVLGQYPYCDSTRRGLPFSTPVP